MELVKTGDSYTVTFEGHEIGIGALAAVIPGRPKEGRSAAWEKLEREVILEHPWCACCAATAELQVHHLVPFHLKPELELVRTNLLVGCVRCHFFVYHLKDWKAYNPLAVQDAERWRKKIEGRLYKLPFR